MSNTTKGEKLKFNNVKDLANHLINVGDLWTDRGGRLTFHAVNTMHFVIWVDDSKWQMDLKNFTNIYLYELCPPTLNDKQLALAWDSEDTHSKTLVFYDKINNCAFNSVGERDGCAYDMYEAIPPEQVPEWALEAAKTLEDAEILEDAIAII